MASSGEHALNKAEERPATPGGIGGKDFAAKEVERTHNDHDYVMVGEDSSREQSSYPTPVGTPLRSMLPGNALQVHETSADVSPQTVFGSLDPKGLAALQAAFHDNFADEGMGAGEHADNDKEAVLAAPESDEGLMLGQPEVTTPGPTKEPRPVQDADGSPEGAETPEASAKLAGEAAPGMKERLEEAQREIERLKRALEEGQAQQEWMLGNVVKSTAAQKEELTSALQAMQDECNALELELKHHEKGFAELVSEELEQRFMRFEEVTLAAVQKMVGIISAPEASPAGERPDGLTAGVNLGALSLPGGMLTAPLCAVPPNMTLLEALQTRQAQDMLSALEAARAPSRHPLDISLQARARLNSAVTTLYASARRRTCLRSRFGKAALSARKSAIKGAQGIVSAGSAVAGGVSHSARCINTASDRAAATTKYGVKSGAVRVKHAALVSGCWVHEKMQKEKLGSVARQVPGALAAPFKAFGQCSLYLDKQRKRPEVKQVAEMYVDLVGVSFLLTVCSIFTVAWIGSLAAELHEEREESQAAHERRREKERLLKSQVCDLETALTIERARAEEADKTAAKAERRMQAAVREARRAEHEALKARAHDDASPVEILDLSRPEEEQGGDEDSHIWRMEPEELFSWNGFPDLDVRGLVNRIRARGLVDKIRGRR